MGRSPRRAYAISAATVILALCAGVFGADLPQFANAPNDRRPDEFGGYASTHIVVKLHRRAEDQVASQRARFRAARGVDPRPWLSGRFQQIAADWRTARMSPLHAEPFGDAALAAKHGLDRTYVIEVPAGSDTPAFARALEALDDEVEVAGLDGIGGVAADQLIPNDTNFDQQYAMNNAGGGDIDAVEAWSIHSGDVGSVIIAIIDSGVTPQDEFAGRMVPGRNTDNALQPTLTCDSCPHGTHVAGIAAAAGNNSLGIAGVTWGAYIMPVRVLNGCSGFVARVANGIIWAADHGANVGNMSLQFYNLNASDRQALQNALNYAHDRGMIMVCAAGNNDGGGAGVVAYPGSLANCLAVGATTAQDVFAETGTTSTGWRSNYGPQVEIAAPGDRIYSTMPSIGPFPGQVCFTGNGFSFSNGTSMATPHVAGLAALIKSYDTTLSADDIRDIIVATAQDKGIFGWDDHYGYGRINAWHALLSAATWPSIVASDPPNRAIDARQPTELDGYGSYGWSVLIMTLETDVSLLTPADFIALRHGATGALPVISSVLPIDTNHVELVLNGPIKVGAWTTIQHYDTGLIRVGYLPGDVNADAASTGNDVTALVASLQGIGDPLPEWSSDIDRSGAATPLDILTEIDLLNGAESFSKFLNVVLP